jgi:delta-aminolevulinic acid dehydratase/porphobilinogen synthase
LAHFGQTPEHLKTPTAEEAFNADGLVQRSIRALKDAYPDLEVRIWACIHRRMLHSQHLLPSSL